MVGRQFSATAAQIVADYGEWAENKERQLTNRSLGQKLKRRGFQSDHTRRDAMWFGVGLCDEFTWNPPPSQSSALYADFTLAAGSQCRCGGSWPTHHHFVSIR